MRLPAPFRSERVARLGALSRGSMVRVPCRLRRTSARGWGAWTEAELVLGGLPDGEARWRCQDPVAVGFPATKGPVDLAFDEVTDVWLRSIRFQTEAFYGREGEIVTVESERGTVEVALSAPETGPVAERLHQLLMGGH